MHLIRFISKAAIPAILISVGSLSCLLAQANEETPPQKPAGAPEIQLEDYTIIGLDKVVLPHKERRSVFKELKVGWAENSVVTSKGEEKPPFRFSQEKPGFALREIYPRLDGSAQYGSYNTVGLNVYGQLNLGNLVPYFDFKYQRSDGWVDRADFERGSADAGLEGKIWNRGILQLTTRVVSGRQSLWSSRLPDSLNLETNSDYWFGQAILKHDFSKRFSGYVNGNIELLNFDNRFDYQQDAFYIAVGGKYRTGQTLLMFEGKYERNKTNRRSRNDAAPISFPLWETNNKIVSGIFRIQQKWDQFSLTGGVVVQGIDTTDSFNSGETKVFPYGKAAFNKGNAVSLFLKFSPGYHFRNMEKMIRAFPVAELRIFRPIKIKNEISGGVTVKGSQKFRLSIGSSYGRAEGYPVLHYLTNDSLPTLPYWEYRYISEADLWKNSFRLNWNINPRLNFEGRFIYNYSSIKTVNEKNQRVSGNEILYLAPFRGTLILDWFFLQKHKLRLEADYTGERYNDVANSVRLDQYFLLNTKVDFNIKKYLVLYFYGNNLFDKRYDIYYTYVAPGITAGAGIQLKY
ncbi:MAG: hypothetical protein ACE5GL_00195 [Calditrichia bacterium]